MDKFKPGLSNLIIYIIIVLSGWNLYRELQTLHVLSMAISMIGLLAAALFFLDNKGYKSLVWVWIVAQLVTISKSEIDPGTGTAIAQSLIFDCSQALNVKLGFYISSGTSSFALNFNVLVIVYFFLLKQLKTSAHIGRSYTMAAQAGSPLETQGLADLAVMITDKIAVDGSQNWLAGTLSAPVVLNGKEYDRVVIQVEDTLLSNVILAIPSDYQLNKKANSSTAFEARNWLYIKM